MVIFYQVFGKRKGQVSNRQAEHLTFHPNPQREEWSDVNRSRVQLGNQLLDAHR
jgi:hypothetical protein